MAITVKRGNREIRTTGAIIFEVTGSDVGSTYDFMGIAKGFRVTDVNVTVDEAFANKDNQISVGLEDDMVRFIPATYINAAKGVAFSNKQYTAPRTTSIVANVTGTASATGKATITVSYTKLADCKQEY